MNAQHALGLHLGREGVSAGHQRGVERGTMNNDTPFVSGSLIFQVSFDGSTGDWLRLLLR